MTSKGNLCEPSTKIDFSSFNFCKARKLGSGAGKQAGFDFKQAKIWENTF